MYIKCILTAPFLQKQKGKDSFYHNWVKLLKKYASTARAVLMPYHVYHVSFCRRPWAAVGLIGSAPWGPLAWPPHHGAVAGTWWPPQEVPPPLPYWPTIKELQLPLIQIRVELAPLQVTPSAVRAVNSIVSDVTGSDTSGCFKGADNQLKFLSLQYKAVPIKSGKRISF